MCDTLLRSWSAICAQKGPTVPFGDFRSDAVWRRTTAFEGDTAAIEQSPAPTRVEERSPTVDNVKPCITHSKECTIIPVVKGP